MSENEKKLVEDNMGLVYFLVKKHYPNYAFDEDIQQIGMIGLCKAAQKWDSKKSTFSTFAGRCIVNEIRHEFKRRNRQKRYCRTISLNTRVDNGEHEIGELMGILVGDSDVNYFDSEAFYSKLSPLQRRILELRCQGKSNREIGELLNMSESNVSQHVRRMNLLWRKIYED